MTTALTVYNASPNSSRLTSAELLVASSGASQGSSEATTVGTGTGWYELGWGGPGSSSGSLPSPTGKGAFFDATTLVTNQLVTGNYSGTITLALSQASKSVSGPLTLRFYKYNTSTTTYTSIGSITTSSQTINSTTATAFNFSATSLSSMNFNTNESLYIDAWINISSNTMTTGGTINNYYSNSSTLGWSGSSFVTPGYGPQSTATNKDVTLRGKVSAQTNKDITLRGKLSGVAYKDITVRGRTSAVTYKDVVVRARLSGLSYKDITLRGKIGGITAFKDVSLRGRVAAKVYKDITLRARTSAATYKDISLRGHIGIAIHKMISLRGRLQGQIFKDVTLRGRISSFTTVFKDVSLRGRLKTTGFHDITLRGRIASIIASGGYTLFANGTGTATYDAFRVTQYPDPSMSLSPVIPRLGSTSVSWTATQPTNTTYAIKTSLDGVNWTDVSSSNGGSIPGLNGQVDPTLDQFTTNTSANYTNTSKTGGSAATVTYDTTNSRMALSGGSSGLYLYTALTDNDVDLVAVMDESDAGGLCWRYVDSSNYYELMCCDDSSSSGFTNQLRLYKVVAGTRSLIGSASIISWPRSTAGTSPYKLIRVTMLGSTITVYFDGMIVQTATDTTFTSGRVGLRNDGGTSRYYQFRILSVGDYVTGTPVTDIVTGDFVYTQVSLSTTDPSVTPQIQDLTTSAYSPQVQRGSLITQLHDPSKPFAEFYNTELDTLASSSGDYWWNINYSSSLSFSSRTATGYAPFCLHSTDLLYAPTVKPLNAADLYRNRQTITNCLGTTSQTESKIADGTASSWTMAYPLYSAPTITVQGVSKTIGVQGVDTGKDFYWQAGSASIGQDASATRITSGYVLIFSYVGQYYTNVTVNNTTEQAARAAIEGGSGIVEASEDGKGMLVSNATTYAQGLLNRFGNNSTVEIDVVTQRPGLAVGTLLPTFIPEHAILDTNLLIVEVITTAVQKVDGTILYQYQVKATNGPNLSNWSKALFS